MNQLFQGIRSYFLFGDLIMWLPLQVFLSQGIFPPTPILVLSFFLSFLYLFFPHPYSSFDVNSLGSFQLNSLSSSSFCYLSSSASFLYFLLNSSTNFFAFSRFSLLSQVSSSTISFPSYQELLLSPYYPLV